MSSEDPDLIAWTLEEVAERHGDPTAAVYERLFAQNPELEVLFVGDKTGAARGEMLAMVFQTMMDFAGKASFGGNMIRAEIVNHENLGVPPDVFATFFRTVMETLRDLLGADWTPAVASAWEDLLTGLDHAIHREAVV